ncbi:MAG: PAS domain S-box protein [Syntrophales bacterium LBB04]|nr:PAS domain S-box protein [Syntrophales bacterium LBB04]
MSIRLLSLLSPAVVFDSARYFTNRKRKEEQLRKSEAFLRTIIEENPYSMWVSDANGTPIRINRACCDLFKISPTELLGKYSLFKDEVLEAQGFLPMIRRTFEEGEVVRFELRYDSSQLRHVSLEKSATVVLDVTIFPIKDASGTVTNAVIQHMDISHRKRMEETLMASKEMFRSIIDASPVCLALHDARQNITYLNPAFVDTFGYTLEEIPSLEKWWSKAYPDPEYRHWVADNWYSRLEKARQENSPSSPMEVTIRHKNGAFKTVLASATLLDKSADDVHLLVLYDITERKQSEEEIRASLTEKELLLKEVHYRVKNNLATIVGMIEMQKAAQSNTQTAIALTELETRLRSMALVHEQLYRSARLTKIDFQDYLRMLCVSIEASIGSRQRVRFKISASVELGLDAAIPCGMIVSELVTNALKYAFPRGQPHSSSGDCEILINLGRREKEYCLVVADNGVGLPSNLDWQTTPTLGLRLIRMLSQNQLGGKIEWDGAAGTRFTLHFTLKKGI